MIFMGYVSFREGTVKFHPLKKERSISYTFKAEALASAVQRNGSPGRVAVGFAQFLGGVGGVFLLGRLIQDMLTLQNRS